MSSPILEMSSPILDISFPILDISSPILDMYGVLLFGTLSYDPCPHTRALQQMGSPLSETQFVYFRRRHKLFTYYRLPSKRRHQVRDVKISHLTNIVLQKLLLNIAFQKSNIVRQMCGGPHYTMTLAEFTLTDGGVPPFVPHCAPIWPQTGPSWHHQGARWCLSTKPLICHQICLRYSPFLCLKCRGQTGIPNIVHATSPLGQ